MDTKNYKKLQPWNDKNTNILSFFRQTADKNPDIVALIDGNLSITYRKLDELTNRLACYLQKNRICKNQIVGIYLDKCYMYIISCLAVLKAGGAYLHIDIDYPTEVINKILHETSPKVIICKSKYLNKFSSHNQILLPIDTNHTWNSPKNILTNNNPLLSSDAAFVGYTSGTTGIPKGIIVTHKAAVYSIYKFWEELTHLENIREFGYATYLSWDAMGPLMFGATAHIIPDNVTRDPLELINYINDNNINHTFFTPSLLNLVLDEIPTHIIKQKLAKLKVLWLGGEVITRDIVQKTYAILPDINLFNNYGPSECFVVAQGPLNKNDYQLDSHSCPVGKVLPEMEVLLFDQQMKKITGANITGELYVSGPCLADGYLNNSKLTREKFSTINNKRYFNTGDLAYFLPDSRLVVEGRKDYLTNNKKVDLLKIKNTIKDNLPVSDCIIIDYQNHNDKNNLICFYRKLAGTNKKITELDMKMFLCTILPDQLIPQKFIMLDKIPINPISQKTNYKILYEIANKIDFNE